MKENIYNGNGFVQMDKQVRAITAIKYKLNWKRGDLFGFIISSLKEENFPDRLTAAEMKNKNVSALYKLMTVKNKRLIIQKLDKIQERNKEQKNRKEINFNEDI